MMVADPGDTLGQSVDAGDDPGRLDGVPLHDVALGRAERTGLVKKLDGSAECRWVL